MDASPLAVAHASWLLLHVLPYSVNSDADAEAYHEFALSLFSIYPCGTCVRNLATEHASYVASLSRAVASPKEQRQDRLAIWALHLHDAVSRSLGRPDPIFADLARRERNGGGVDVAKRLRAFYSNMFGSCGG